MQHAQLSPGWYVDARGKKMYWTGHEWVSKAPARPTQNNQTADRRQTTPAPIAAMPSALRWDASHSDKQTDSSQSKQRHWGPLSVVLLIVAITVALAVGWVVSDKVGSVLGLPVAVTLNVPISPFS